MTATLTTSKRIEFDRVTHDFNAYFDDQYLGSFPHYHAAECALNDHAMRLIEDGLVDLPQTLLNAVPDGTPADDYSDVPAGPGEPERCPTCAGDGSLCWDCGSIDQPAIGRKIVYLMHHDRETLLRILDGTPRNQWELLARAYVAALGPTEQGQWVPALGVVSLWRMLLNDASAVAHEVAA